MATEMSVMLVTESPDSVPANEPVTLCPVLNRYEKSNVSALAGMAGATRAAEAKADASLVEICIANSSLFVSAANAAPPVTWARADVPLYAA
jgi:hypothetical protein